jgi:hypothetical protein
MGDDAGTLGGRPTGVVGGGGVPAEQESKTNSELYVIKDAQVDKYFILKSVKTKRF